MSERLLTARERLGAVLAPDVLAALEELIAERVHEELDGVAGGSDPVTRWVSVVEAAELLRCKRQRVDDLLSQRRLTRFKDGSRTLISRRELEEYVRKQGR